MNTIKEIYIKNCTYCSFNGMINIKSFHLNKTKIDNKSYKNIFIYYTRYLTIKNFSYVKSQECKSSFSYY